MNRFALGLVTACLFTTPEGRKLVEGASRVAVKGGDQLLKRKLGVDVRQILNEEDIKNDGISNQSE